MVSVKKAVEAIRRRGVVAFPTETAYALGGNALDKGVADRIYEMKGRERGKKFPVVVDSLKRLKGVADIHPLGVYLSHHLHPGPFNIAVRSDMEWIGAFRISSSAVAQKIAKGAELPLIATSANPAGKRPAYSGEEVKDYFDIPVVEGKLKETPVSTIYDPEKRKVIREGEVVEKTIRIHEVAFDVLKMIKPSEKEVRELMKQAEKALEIVRRTHEESILGGSVAKGSFLKGDREIDIFLLFPKGIDLEERLGLLKEVAHTLGEEVEISYAQHPYVRVKFEDIVVEIVPAYLTKPPEVLSAADRSRWHVDYVVPFPEWLKDEIRIFKKFCRGIGVYGADLKVEGLSAYAIEVLTLENRGFVESLREVKRMKWRPKRADPVDKNRNVLASISREKFNLLKEAAEAFLKDPHESFFFPKEPKAGGVPGLKGVSVVRVEKPDMVEDAVWGRAKKIARKISRNARLKGYDIEKKAVFVDEDIFIAFKMDSLRNEEIVVNGPPVDKGKHVKKFKEAHENWFEDRGVLYAREKAKFPNFSDLVANFVEGEVLEGEELRKTFKKSRKEWKIWLGEFLSDKRPWER